VREESCGLIQELRVKGTPRVFVHADEPDKQFKRALGTQRQFTIKWNAILMGIPWAIKKPRHTRGANHPDRRDFRRAVNATIPRQLAARKTRQTSAKTCSSRNFCMQTLFWQGDWRCCRRSRTDYKKVPPRSRCCVACARRKVPVSGPKG